MDKLDTVAKEHSFNNIPREEVFVSMDFRQVAVHNQVPLGDTFNGFDKVHFLRRLIGVYTRLNSAKKPTPH